MDEVCNKMLYIKTFGCQMNIYDSKKIIDILSNAGYIVVNDLEKANLIILNTCSIRKKAEQKVFSYLGKINKLKKLRKSLLIGVGGCVAQQYGKNILMRFKKVNFVFGTNAVYRILNIIFKIQTYTCKIVDTGFTNKIEYKSSGCFFGNVNIDVTCFVTIMRGCDNHCSYCIVPKVRGAECSRNVNSILKEVELFTMLGIKEFILLGQNVNSYGKKENSLPFSNLLNLISRIDRVKRIRFITSHPKDLSVDLINSFLSIDILSKHIHLPVQSGSNCILKKMNRNYLIEDYFDKVNFLRFVCPEISITSDIIVGFPGETIIDFSATCNLIRKIKFDKLFIFSYSDRLGTPAFKIYSKVSETKKAYRINKLLLIQRDITFKKNILQ